MAKVKIINIDTDIYEFASILEEHFSCCDGLEQIHLSLPVWYDIKSLELNDQDSILHRHVYTIGDEFLRPYRELVKEISCCYFDTEMIYQTIPTFRFHMPGSKAVKEFHRDTDYNHYKECVTVWLPLTNCYGTNTIWIEYDKNFIPIGLEYGQAMIFDSANMLHGNYVNNTRFTRVSFDFRLLDYDTYHTRYKNATNSTINQHTEMVIGQYYSRM
jgi:hypothetical protein